MGPILHVWYCKGLPSIGHILFSETTKKATRVFVSMSIDQTVFAPLVITGFFLYHSLLNGTSIKVQGEKLWETLKCNWMIWPAAMTVNFWFMPLRYQVLFSNFVGLFWNVILSYLAHKEEDPATSIKMMVKTPKKSLAKEVV